MNQFLIHARVLHMEPPKQEGKSGLMLVKINDSVTRHAAKSVTNEGSTVDKVLVRYPGHLHEKVEGLMKEHMKGTKKTVELFGNIGGIAKRGVLGGDQFLHAELVAQRITDLEVAPNFSGNDSTSIVDHHLYNHVSAVGIVESIIKPDAEKGRPMLVYLRTGPRRADRGRLVEHSNVLTFNMQGAGETKALGMSKGDSVIITGNVVGMLRRVEGAIPGMAQESLEPRLVGLDFQTVSHIPASVLRDGRRTADQYKQGGGAERKPVRPLNQDAPAS